MVELGRRKKQLRARGTTPIQLVEQAVPRPRPRRDPERHCQGQEAEADREIWGGGTLILTRCPEPETCQVNAHNGQAPQTLRAQGGTPAPPSLPILLVLLPQPSPPIPTGQNTDT